MMIEVTDAQRQEIAPLLQRRDLAPRQRERLEMVKAVALRQDIATNWLRTLRKGRAYAYGRPKHTLKHLQDPPPPLPAPRRSQR